ncbi:hypothetical protein HDV01_002823 [Terramyces sp. JEL0728]|nr:hypothetical protein HDV01_002823 [Terramyces sp. JEL0728]
MKRAHHKIDIDQEDDEDFHDFELATLTSSLAISPRKRVALHEKIIQQVEKMQLKPGQSKLKVIKEEEDSIEELVFNHKLPPDSFYKNIVDFKVQNPLFEIPPDQGQIVLYKAVYKKEVDGNGKDVEMN